MWRFLAEPLEAAGRLRAAGIRCEVHPATDKLGKQLKLADQKRIPLVVVVGPDELARGVVSVRDMNARDQLAVPRDALVEAVRERLESSTG